MRSIRSICLGGCIAALASAPMAFSMESVVLTDIPDYSWHTGCFGTASGILMGYWDRHGFPDYYTGPTAGGVAPLFSNGQDVGIQSMWASRAGFDGRPEDQPGHVDDYWTFYLDDERYSYESAITDPYILAGRAEHAPDCIGDFIGASQNRWQDMDGECDGNIDGFAFNSWDSTGERRINYNPVSPTGHAFRDVQSGLRVWSTYRGYKADVFSQLTDFNPQAVASGKGFTFEDLKAEIDAGYPVMLFLQNFDEKSRVLPGMERANPRVHAMVAFGYYIGDAGDRWVRYKTSWGGSGINTASLWGAHAWQASLQLRGVIGFRPHPKITKITAQGQNSVTIEWEGPSSELTDLVTGSTVPLHHYIIEKSNTLSPASFEPIGESTTERFATVPFSVAGDAAFFRVRLMNSAE